jgi:hypothetical protein
VNEEVEMKPFSAKLPFRDRTAYLADQIDPPKQAINN